MTNVAIATTSQLAADAAREVAAGGGNAVDCALAASYFMLAAADRGLGTCWVALGGEIRDPELLATVGLSESDAVVAPIILGRPAAIPKAPARKDPEIVKTIG